MKKDIIIAGVGGQGIVSIASVIGYSAIESGLFLKQSEVHGMSQRGGDVYSNLRISDVEVNSDLIPLGKADMIISVEPMESLRYIPYLSRNGWLITNLKPFKNIPDYPPIDAVEAKVKEFKNSIIFDADKIARKLGSPKSANMVILGAASPFLEIEFSLYEKAMNFIFGRKGDKVVQVNIDAIKAGREIAMERV